MIVKKPGSRLIIGWRQQALIKEARPSRRRFAPAAKPAPEAAPKVAEAALAEE